MTASSQRQQSDALLTIPQLASMVGLHASTLYRSLDRGEFPLPLIKLGGRIRVSRAAAERLIQGAAPPVPITTVGTLAGPVIYCPSCKARLRSVPTCSAPPTELEPPPFEGPSGSASFDAENDR
jgi:excisionase family DNA binding protein